MAVGRSLDLQPLERFNPLNFHKISVWRHRIQHGYHSIVAPCAAEEGGPVLVSACWSASRSGLVIVVVGSIIAPSGADHFVFSE